MGPLNFGTGDPPASVIKYCTMTNMIPTGRNPNHRWLMASVPNAFMTGHFIRPYIVYVCPQDCIHRPTVFWTSVGHSNKSHTDVSPKEGTRLGHYCITQLLFYRHPYHTYTLIHRVTLVTQDILFFYPKIWILSGFFACCEQNCLILFPM